MLKKRVQAFTIDMMIIVVTNYALVKSFTHFLRVVFFHLPITSQMFLIKKFNMFNSISILSIAFAYFSIFLYVTNGKTFGKMILGLTVKSENGEITLPEAMKRSFTYIACAMLGSVLFALPFIRKDQKSLADIISKTTVVSDYEEIAAVVVVEEQPMATILELTPLEKEAAKTEVIEEDKAA